MARDAAHFASSRLACAGSVRHRSQCCWGTRFAASDSSIVGAAFDRPPAGVTPARSSIDRFPASAHSSSGSCSPDSTPATRTGDDVTRRASASKASSPVCAALRSAQAVSAAEARARTVPCSSSARSMKSGDGRAIG